MNKEYNEKHFFIIITNVILRSRPIIIIIYFVKESIFVIEKGYTVLLLYIFN